MLELVPVVLGIEIWAEALQSQKLLLHIDNLALVHVFNNKTSKNEKVMSLVRYLVLISLQFNIQVRAEHVPGSKNQIADSISRFQWKKFRDLAPWADPYPCQVPRKCYQLLLTMSKS